MQRTPKPLPASSKPRLTASQRKALLRKAASTMRGLSREELDRAVSVADKLVSLRTRRRQALEG